MQRKVDKHQFVENSASNKNDAKGSIQGNDNNADAGPPDIDENATGPPVLSKVIMAIYDNVIIKLDDPNIDQPAAFAALKRLEGEMKRRIHQQGQSSDGTQLSTFAEKKDPAGYYSKQWGSKRRRFGRTVSKKDLQFYGDLLRAHTVGTFNDRFVYGFLYDMARIIAEGQEGQTRKPIFSISDRERDLVVQIYSERLVQDIFG